jgi:hypothetical protein
MLFFTSASKLNFGGSSTKVNGISVSNTINCFSESACITNLSSIPKVDGGYYIDLPNYNYLEATITGTDPCSGTITPSSSSVVASSSSVTPASSSGGTVINIGYNSYVLFTSGTYQLSLIPDGSVFRCTIGASVNYDRTVATFNGTGLVILHGILKELYPLQ